MEEIRKILIIWLSAIFILSSSFVSVSADNDSIIEDNQDLEDEINYPTAIESFWVNTSSSSIKYKIATNDDIEIMKETIGVYDQNTNYNQIVDGYGTGYAPPTLEEYELMTGQPFIEYASVNEITLSSFDHSTSVYFPAVGNQGQQGSCTAWAVGYYSNGYLQAKDNGWTDAWLGNTDHIMSPAWLYNKINHGIDSGSNPQMATWFLDKIGCSPWSLMPYWDDGIEGNTADIIPWGNESSWRSAPKYRTNNSVSWFYPFIPWDDADIALFKDVLINQDTTINFGINTTNFGASQASPDNNILSSLEMIFTDSNHAQTIVGYDDNISEDGNIGAFKVVNSWGTGWGDAGYYWITYDAFKLTTSPVSWLRDDSNYEPTLTAVWEFDPAGARDATITWGVGSYASPLETKSHTFDAGTHDFSTFMCIDITEFEDEYLAGTNDFFLEIGSGTTSSTISEFWVEYYDWGAGDTLYSPPSLDTPEVTPGYVTVGGTFGKYPEVTINIHAINEIDDIDGATGADWYYYTCLYDGEYTWTPMQGPWIDQSFVVVDREHDYRATSTIVYPIIMLCEEDLVWDDYADVSSDAAGGVDDVDHPITPPASGYYAGSYCGTYDIRDGSLSGDTVIEDMGYWLTSGDFDGSTGNDENDAEIWFDIWDNYELPVANPGPNQVINTSISSNAVLFDGSSSTASGGSTLVSYYWDFGEGNSSTDISPTHEYQIDGVYVVSLTVTDNMGESDTDFCIITVEGSKVHNYGRGKTYCTIQYALDDAELHNWIGDTINVDPGTFNEAIDIRIPIDLIGSGIDATFINGGDNDTIGVWSDFVNISDFNVSGNSIGIDLGRDHCNIFNNSILAQNGINIFAVANSKLSNNSMFGCSVFLNGGDLVDYNNLIVLPSNTVNGRPVYYYKDVVGIPIPPNAGEVILINCTDMEISNQHFFNATVGYEVIFSSNITVNYTNSSFNWIGGLVAKSFNSSVDNCTMLNNSVVGFYLVYYSHNNTILSNSFIDNENGMIIYESIDNWIYHNSFVNNNVQAYDDTDANYWNSAYPMGGNYWSDYTGIDVMSGPGQDQTGTDGIGDTPYNPTYGQGIQGGTTEDNYPLVSPGDFEDIIYPTSQIDSITPFWFTSSLTITATAIDTRSSLVSVELWYSFEGGAYQLFGTDTLAPWQWNFNWPEGEGNYTFYSIAEDSNANIEPAPTIEDEDAGYDYNAPVSTVNSITPYWQGAPPLIINATASDGISGVASVELFYRHSSDGITWSNWISFGVDNMAPWSWSFDLQNDVGFYEYYTIATDNTSNVELAPGTADTICGYDSGPPEITDESTTSATTGETFSVTVTAEDDIELTSVHVIYWFGNGTTTNATAILVSSNIYEFTIQIPSNSTLELNYYVGATDHLGKWTSTSVKIVTITDNDDPTANAGLDQIVVEDTIVTFNGAGSNDNIEVFNYTWTFHDGIQDVILYGVNPLHNFSVPGSYTVTLLVSDLAGNLDNDTLIITVQLDTDGDSIPDDTDLDDDNDGVLDEDDPAPLDSTITGISDFGDYWWILLIMAVVIVIITALFMRKKPPTNKENSLQPPPPPES